MSHDRVQAVERGRVLVPLRGHRREELLLDAGIAEDRRELIVFPQPDEGGIRQGRHGRRHVLMEGRQERRLARKNIII